MILRGTITQSGTSAPAVTFTGQQPPYTITCVRDGEGIYRLTSDGHFAEGASFLIGALRSVDFTSGMNIFQGAVADEDTITIESAVVSWDGGFNSVLYGDGLLLNTPFTLITP